MTRNVSLDIGFDRDALPNPGNWNRPLLRFGFTVPNEDGNPVALARELLTGDRLLITVYDLSENPAFQIDYMSLRLRFQMARQQENKSPSPPPSSRNAVSSHRHPRVNYARYDIFPGIETLGYSTVFEGCFPIWNIYPPQENSRLYPRNQLFPEQPMPPQESLDITNNGSFYYAACLKLKWRDSPGGRLHSRIFRVDPEMVVDNNGPVPDPIQH